MRVELDFDFNLGCLGMHMGKVLADVEGMKVTLLAASIRHENDNILPLLNLTTIEEIKRQLRENHGAQDAVFDWDPPGGVA